MDRQPHEDDDGSDLDDGSRRLPFGGALTEAFYGALSAEVERQLAEGRDPRELAERVTKLDMKRMLESTSGSTYSTLLDRLPQHIEYLSKGADALQAEMREVWGAADDLYQAASYLGFKIGANISESLRVKGPKMSAILGAHGRALRVAGEVRLLAMSGFGGGASARWRSLHDLTVLCAVLNEADEGISKRYLAFKHIEVFKDMLVYQEHVAALGYPPYTDAEVSASKARYDSVRAEWGPEMSKSQGWAFPLFPGAKKVDFADLEQLAGLAYLRPFYKLGNNFVHAGPHGAALNMRIHLTEGTRLINTGATVFQDIAETCHGAMISLHQATVNLVASNLKESRGAVVDLLVGLKAQGQFVDDGGDAWGAAAVVARSRGWFTHKPSTATEGRE